MASKSSLNTVKIVFEIVGALLGIGFFIFIFMSIATISPFQYGQPGIAVPLEQIPDAVSSALWSYRGIDMILQAIVLFATAVGAVALFREEMKRRKEE